MTTALAILNQGKMVLSDLEIAIAEEAANETAAYEKVPTKISMPSGKDITFSTPDGAHLDDLNCIIIVSQMARAYWPGKGLGNPPMCSSFDSAVGILNGLPDKTQFQAAMTARIPHPAIPLLVEDQPIPATFRCGTCPMAQWGSAHQIGNGESRSQACKSLRRLVLIVEGWPDGALLTLPPTSVKGFDVYASALARDHSAYYAVRTRITLEKQQAGDNIYAIARFKKIGALTTQEFAAVRELRAQYAALVRSMPIESAEYETQGDMPTFHGPDGDGNENPF